MFDNKEVWKQINICKSDVYILTKMIFYNRQMFCTTTTNLNIFYSHTIAIKYQIMDNQIISIQFS